MIKGTIFSKSKKFVFINLLQNKVKGILSFLEFDHRDAALIILYHVVIEILFSKIR